MAKQKVKIYACSNVSIDYFFFLCKTVATDGYEVEPVYLLDENTYRKLAKTAGIKKIWLRIQTYFIYPLLVIYKAVLAPRGSVFIVTSNTFFAPLLVKWATFYKRLPVIHLLYDLFPDAMEVAGKAKPGSFASLFVGRITRLNQSRCNGTVYLGDFLKQHAESRWGKAPFGKIIHISTDLTLYENNFTPLEPKPPVIVHYGGQLGYLHDAVSIIECVKAIHQDPYLSDKVTFNFYVSGAQAEFLEKSLAGYRVQVISTVPSSQWRKDIAAFHIGLVSLSPGGASVCLPSKSFGMMAGGMAMLGICPKWSDLAGLIEDLDAGWVINNSAHQSAPDGADPEYLSKINDKRDMASIISDFKAILQLVYEDNHVLNQKRKNAFEGVRSKHNIEILGRQWGEFIRMVVREQQ